jgi:hypothetical protein
MLIEILVILLAGWGAGVVTGLIGASAVAVVTSSLVTFLGYSPYEAIGVSLATDVVASLTAAYTYSGTEISTSDLESKWLFLPS